MVSISSSIHLQAISGENAPALGAPQGAPTISSLSWITRGAVSQQYRKHFARSMILGMPGFSLAILVMALAR